MCVYIHMGVCVSVCVCISGHVCMTRRHQRLWQQSNPSRDVIIYLMTATFFSLPATGSVFCPFSVSLLSAKGKVESKTFKTSLPCSFSLQSHCCLQYSDNNAYK